MISMVFELYHNPRSLILKICFLLLQLRREGRVTNVSDVVTRGQKVKAKVLSFTGNKPSLSIKVCYLSFVLLRVISL